MLVVPVRNVHGLSGKVSNHASLEQQRLFIDYVQGERTPTGRTKDDRGRSHGAE